MRAVVIEGVGEMAVLDRPEPPAPGPREALAAPEAVGICGSDYHFFTGELSEAAGGSQFPRVLGAEGPGGWDEIDFKPPLAARLDKDWSYLGVRR